MSVKNSKRIVCRSLGMALLKGVVHARTTLALAAVLALSIMSILSAYGGTITYLDDFDDGDADGWWLGYSLANPAVYGNWWVEDGVLVQQHAGDGFTALLDDFVVSDQIVETELKLVGFGCYGGIHVWFHDGDNRVSIRVYPAVNKVFVGEVTGGVASSEYYITDLHTSTWYKLRVEANSTSGNVSVYLDDVYLFTSTVATPNRSGQTGVFNGNSSEGAYFDNFSLTSESVLTDKIQCKADRWTMYRNPSFKNQGECVACVQSRYE